MRKVAVALAKSPELWKLLVILLATVGLTGESELLNKVSPLIVELLGQLLG